MCAVRASGLECMEAASKKTCRLSEVNVEVVEDLGSKLADYW